jgi:RsiW-degrading membrane proteinase PrsW (M82 family)
LTLCMKPETIDVGLLLGVAAFTAIVGVTAAFLVEQIPAVKSLFDGKEGAFFLVRWAGMVLGVGLVEEAVKALPVYLFVYRPGRGYRPLTYAYVGVVSGLAFGVAEAVGYSYSYAAALRVDGPDQIGLFVVVQLMRLISLPLLHACWSAVVGYFIGLSSISEHAPRVLMALGLLLAALLHGTYDTFAGGWLGAGAAALTIFVFISYVRTGDMISQTLHAGDEDAVESGTVAISE